MCGSSSRGINLKGGKGGVNKEVIAIASKVNRAFAQAFNAWLESKGLSGMSAAFETDLEVSVATINLWKRGRQPDASTLRRFARHFEDCPLDQWLGLLEERRAA